MVIQAVFLNVVDINTTKKRVRYKVPTYKKSDKINQNIKKCKSNQKHIFRYKALHYLYSEIALEVYARQLKLNLGEFVSYKDGLTIHFDPNANQAEITGTELLPVGERIRIHIRLLRLLRQGCKVKKAIKLCR